MPQIAVQSGVRTKMRILASRTRNIITRAQERALAEEKQEVAESLQEYWRQDALEQQLDEIVAQAAKGLTAIIEFGRLPEVQELVLARSSIGKRTPLYEAFEGDEHSYVALFYAQKAVTFVITGSRRSLSQSVGGMTRFDDCEMRHSFPLANQKFRFRRAWLRYFFLQTFASHWYDFDVEYSERRVKEGRLPVKKGDLDSFADVDARLAQAGKWDEDGNWDCNHVLIRVLCDCCSSKKLNQYFERTLAKLD